MTSVKKSLPITISYCKTANLQERFKKVLKGVFYLLFYRERCWENKACWVINPKTPRTCALYTGFQLKLANPPWSLYIIEAGNPYHLSHLESWFGTPTLSAMLNCRINEICVGIQICLAYKNLIVITDRNTIVITEVGYKLYSLIFAANKTIIANLFSSNTSI